MKTSTIEKVFHLLSIKYPEPKTELQYKNNYTFLISVVLSAQTTDVSVNKVTKDLFKIVKNPKEMIKFGEVNLKKYIKSIGLYNSKAKNLINLSKILINKYNNKIPKDFHQLTSLPGVGNKRRYGEKMTLNKPESHDVPDEIREIEHLTPQGKSHQMRIKIWRQSIVMFFDMFGRSVIRVKSALHHSVASFSRRIWMQLWRFTSVWPSSLKICK